MLTISAVLGTLVAFLFVLGRQKPNLGLVVVKSNSDSAKRKANLRSNVDDFVTK